MKEYRLGIVVTIFAYVFAAGALVGAYFALNEVTISQEPIQEVRLMNSQGETVRFLSECKEGALLDVRSLKRGQYYLHVTIKDQVIKEQIVLK